MKWLYYSQPLWNKKSVNHQYCLRACHHHYHHKDAAAFPASVISGTGSVIEMVLDCCLNLAKFICNMFSRALWPFSRCLILLEQFYIYYETMASFVGEMNTFKALSHLSISECDELPSIGGLHFISSLCSLKISYCSKFTSWLNEGNEQRALPQKLDHICINGCPNMKSLPIWLSQSSFFAEDRNLKLFFDPVIARRWLTFFT